MTNLIFQRLLHGSFGLVGVDATGLELRSRHLHIGIVGLW